MDRLEQSIATTHIPQVYVSIAYKMSRISHFVQTSFLTAVGASSKLLAKKKQLVSNVRDLQECLGKCVSDE